MAGSSPQVALQVNVLALLRRAGRACCEAESVELATALQQLLVTCCQVGTKGRWDQNVRMS